jgi:hypothetical protein
VSESLQPIRDVTIIHHSRRKNDKKTHHQAHYICVSSSISGAIMCCKLLSRRQLSLKITSECHSDNRNNPVESISGSTNIGIRYASIEELSFRLLRMQDGCKMQPSNFNHINTATHCKITHNRIMDCHLFILKLSHNI